MIDDDDHPPIDYTALPAPRLFARMRFFVRRYPGELAVLGGLVAGGGTAALIVLASGLWSAGNEAILISSTAVAFATLLTGIMPLFLTRERIATHDDLAAALKAATAPERPHLFAAIKNRLSSRQWSNSLTTFELVLLFENTREQHGDRARRKRLVDQRGRIEQERFVGSLGGVSNDAEHTGQGAI